MMKKTFAGLVILAAAMLAFSMTSMTAFADEAVTGKAAEAVEMIETVEEVESVEEATPGNLIREKKLGINFVPNPTIPVSYKGVAITPFTYSQYMSGYSGVNGKFRFTKLSSADSSLNWIDVDTWTGEITGTPPDNYVNGNRTLRIQVTSLSNSSDNGTVSITVRPTYTRENDRQNEPVVTFTTTDIESLFTLPIYGKPLPSLTTFTSGDPYYSMTAKWQARNVNSSVWTDLSPSAVVEDYKFYRVYVNLSHSLAATGSVNDNRNQGYDFGSSTIIRLRYGGAITESLTMDGTPVRAFQTGTSTAKAYSREFLPVFDYSTGNYLNGYANAGAGTVEAGDNAGYYRYDHETGIGYNTDYNDTGDHYLNIKVTPASGYALESMKDAKGKTWSLSELQTSYSGNNAFLKIDLADDPTVCAGKLLFYFTKLPTDVSLNIGNRTIFIGDTLNLKATVTPSDCRLPVKWENTNTSVARVDSNGKVTALKEGTANISATVRYGTTVRSDTCTVFVKSVPISFTLQNTLTGVNISWDAVKNASCYYIMRDGVQIAKKYSYSGTTHKDSSAVLGNTYVYKIIAVWDPNHIGREESLGKSEEISWTFERPKIEIEAVANTTKGVMLTWAPMEGVTSYTVSREIAEDPSSREMLASDIADTAWTAPLEGLESGVKYKYIVSGRNQSSVYFEGSAERYYIGTTKMNAPTCMAAGLRVTWPKVPGAKKYVIFRHIGSGAVNWKYLTTVDATEDAVQVFNNNPPEGQSFTPGGWYAYTVRAIGEENTYGGQPSGRSVRYREPVQITKLQSISTGVRATFTSVEAGWTYGLYRAKVTGTTTGAYSLVSTVTNAKAGKDVWITDKTAVNGTKYKYYVRCLSADKSVPLSSYKNTMTIIYKKP